MNRRHFIGIAGGAVIAAGGAGYVFSDKRNFVRADLAADSDQTPLLNADEHQILTLASLAPSGHNTQPWFVRRLEPLHWIVGNDKTKWLPAVDPNQRETILSLGAFRQNLEYAAGSLGYVCEWKLLAETNQSEQVMEVKLSQKGPKSTFDTARIRERRTVRSGFLSDGLKKEDVEPLVGPERELIHYLPTGSKEGRYLNEQTIEANRVQTYRDPAQAELAEWIRFSSKEAEKRRDGLTTAGMEIEGLAGWWVRNFYGKNDVMKAGFRERGLDKVREQVSGSAGWILITSRGESVPELLETGRRMQRLLLQVRERNIAIHPMTQILEEPSTRETLNRSIGIDQNIQFILRVGYLKNYPPPVSLRRPVSWFLRG
ncbi:MAG: nitroreductase [Pyrinomonadaceae bacterium]